MAYSFILLRGLVREAAHWGEFLDHMHEHFPESGLHCLDLPGAGAHYLKRCPTSITEIVRFMRAEFLRLELPKDRPVVLIATSLGGMITAQWVQDFPKDFQVAVFVNTSYGSYSPFWQRLQPRALKQLCKVFVLKGFSKEHRILEVVSNRPELYPKIAAAWAQIGSQRPVSAENTLRQLVAAARFKTKIEKPPMRVLLLASTQDRMVSVECTRAIARSWGETAVEHPTAGHDLPTDEPRWIAEQIQRFVKSL